MYWVTCKGRHTFIGGYLEKGAWPWASSKAVIPKDQISALCTNSGVYIVNEPCYTLTHPVSYPRKNILFNTDGTLELQQKKKVITSMKQKYVAWGEIHYLYDGFYIPGFAVEPNEFGITYQVLPRKEKTTHTTRPLT